MAKYSTNIDSKHGRAKKELRNAYPNLFVNYQVRSSKEFVFELERDLTEEEWERMPNLLIIYNSEDGVFEGELKT